MKSNLTLITTETFGDLPCNFYRNTNDDVLLTREQIGQALDYADPIKAIQKIHLKHKDRLDKLSVLVKGDPQFGGDLTKSEEQERTYYTQRGIMEICRWSRQPKANIFMDWVWDIVEKYRSNKLTPIQTQSIDMTQITETISIMTKSVTALTNNMLQIQQDIQAMKEESLRKKPPEKKYSRWKTVTFKKLNTLLSYVNCHSDENLSLSNIIHLIIEETEDTYNIEVNDYVAAYKSEFSLDADPYTIDVINHYKDVKNMFSCTLDAVLEKLHITNNSTKLKSKNIFDELATQLEK